MRPDDITFYTEAGCQHFHKAYAKGDMRVCHPSVYPVGIVYSITLANIGKEDDWIMKVMSPMAERVDLCQPLKKA